MDFLKKLLLTVYLLTTCCAQISQATPKPVSFDTNVDKALIPYFEKFIMAAAKHNCQVSPVMSIGFEKDYTKEFPKLSENVVGLCTTYSFGKTITFKKSYWKKISGFQRRVLAVHEFGHCFLNRDHDETMFDKTMNNSGCPTSVMYPTVVSDDCSDYAPLYAVEIFQTEACRPEVLDAK